MSSSLVFEIIFGKDKSLEKALIKGETSIKQSASVHVIIGAPCRVRTF